MRWTEQDLADHLEKRGVAGAGNTASTAAPPFLLPPDVVLDLPPPPSVNRTRRIDWASRRTVKAWENVANAYVLHAKMREREPLKVTTKIQRFELLVTVSESMNRLDLDNGLKCLIDYLKHAGIIEDDGPNHMRRIVVEFGRAPMGCRVTIRPCLKPAQQFDGVRG